MQHWNLALEVPAAHGQSLFVRLAAAIAEDIRRGRLRPGDVLPGTRELALRLGVSRNTVVAGYAELVAEGLVVTRTGGGTFVADPLPRAPVSVLPLQAVPTFALDPPSVARVAASTAAPPDLLAMTGMPDPRLFPAAELARAFRCVIERRGRRLLDAADPHGHVRLRTAIAQLLSRSRGLAASADNVMATRSIEQGIDLVARTLISPGDVVVVERFGYPPAWSLLRLAGARLVPLPVDRDGLDVDALAALLPSQRIRAVFVTPHHQFPTSTVLSAGRRAKLAALALEHRFAIVEDDYDHEFHYDGDPVMPLAAGPARGNVVYLGSLANLLAPGSCLGFVSAPPVVFERLVALRAASDARCDAALECAIAALFEDGEMLRHARRLTHAYHARRDALVAALRRELGGALAFDVPPGGCGLWARVADDIDPAAWEVAARAAGVGFAGADRYDASGAGAPFVRLGFTHLDERELGEAARRMARALGTLQASHAARPASTGRTGSRNSVRA